MKKVLEAGKYLVVVAVTFSLAASVAAFLWGGLKTVEVIVALVTTHGKAPHLSIDLIALMDAFLIATALLIFSFGMYELFIEDLSLPAWLVIHNLDDLKHKLSSIIILVLAVTFLEHLVAWTDALDTLYLGLAVAAVSATLIAYRSLGHKE